MLLVGLLLLGLPFVGFLMIQLELKAAIVIGKMTGKRLNRSDKFLMTLMSIIPFVNLIIAVMNIIMDKECIKLFKNHEIANEMYKCPKCEIYQRRYQQDNFRYKAYGWYSNGERIEETKCCHCDYHTTYREKNADKKKIMMAKKINIAQAFLILMKENKGLKREEKIKKLKEKMSDIEMNDKQLEAYQKIQEVKMVEYEKKAKNIQKELEEMKKKSEEKEKKEEEMLI